MCRYYNLICRFYNSICIFFPDDHTLPVCIIKFWSARNCPLNYEIIYIKWVLSLIYQGGVLSIQTYSYIKLLYVVLHMWSFKTILKNYCFLWNKLFVKLQMWMWTWFWSLWTGFVSMESWLILCKQPNFLLFKH